MAAHVNGYERPKHITRAKTMSMVSFCVLLIPVALTSLLVSRAIYAVLGLQIGGIGLLVVMAMLVTLLEALTMKIVGISAFEGVAADDDALNVKLRERKGILGQL